MTKFSMKALLGAGAMAVVAAVSLTPAAHAQGQPGTMPGTMNAAPQQPVGMAPAPQQNGYMPQQNAYLPQQQGTAGPLQFRQMNARYPGPKLN